ncbi:AAA family ATPase [Burkholderia pseudomallei]|uniref:AAA family ATPase n=1 Tax=Burkholderia pseudomallei TaxID=28450 RepID=UPI0021F76373|nr:AAA family ATPase [Burkholderia pseudomallei]MCW0080572.1 AAA family ATPase [Burkholderia pseudomallei]
MFSNILRNRSNGDNGPVLEVAIDIPVVAVPWLWIDWLARGKLHLLAGPPSTGKTTLALAVAATLTNGGTWPDGTWAAGGRVLIWTCEDGIEDTIMPRLVASGANLENAYILRETSENGRRRAFDFGRDLQRLEAKVRELGDVVLIIIDSVAQLVSGNSNSNTQVRKDLDPLVAFAEQTGIAILGLTHVVKGSKKKDPLDRMNGSTAFGAVARIVWIVARHESDRTGNGVSRSVLVRAKSNIGPIDGGFVYHIDAVTVPAGMAGVARSSKIAWDEQLEGAPRDILNDAEGGQASASDDRKQEAMNFLEVLLAAVPQPVETVQQQAAQARIAWATVRRAADALGVKKYRPMGDVKWYWTLENDSGGGGWQPSAPTGSPGSPWISNNLSDATPNSTLPARNAPLPPFAAPEGSVWGWANGSQQRAMPQAPSTHEKSEQHEQHEQVAQAGDGIDSDMWNFMVNCCREKYQAAALGPDDDEYQIRESIVDFVLQQRVVDVDEAWVARAKATLLRAEFWYSQ